MITNSGAVLGLGNMGHLPGETPSMERKAILSRWLINVDVFDILIKTPHSDGFISEYQVLRAHIWGIDPENIVAIKTYKLFQYRLCISMTFLVAASMARGSAWTTTFATSV